MTRTVQIEKLIELLSSIAGKFAANPTMSHLVTDGVEAVNVDGLILKLDVCAKKTAVKSFEADFMAFQEETPTLEDPQSVRVWDGMKGFKFFMFDSNNHHDSYLVPLKYISIGGSSYEIAGGHINVITGVATITHVKETLMPVDDWHKSNTYDGSFYVTRSLKKSNTNFLTNHSECVALDNYAYGYCTASSKNLNFWYMAEGTTTDEFKEWLSNHPIEVAYELATPVQVQLDPVTIKTLNDNTCYIQTYQGCITNVEGEYIRDVAAAIEALEEGGGSVVETIMGDLDREYGITPANYIGTLNQWDSIDTGKSFADYDEIILVMKPQANPVYGSKIYTSIVNVTLLQHYDKYALYAFPEGNATSYVKCGLDYTNNKFFLENLNYMCPIALIGVKH